MNLTHDELKRLLRYNRRTGIFYWRVRRHHNPAGMIAGWKNNGHVYITINRKVYGAGRLAWFYVHGKFPKKEIDHKDRNGEHNWISNLREADRFQQMANQGAKSRNKTGLKGVSQHHNPNRKRRWRARIRVRNKSIWLGFFLTKEEAHYAYIKAAKKYNGSFAPQEVLR